MFALKQSLTFAGLLCFFFLPYHFGECYNTSTLKSLIIVHRHGDRTPIRLYSNDPYRNESFWPDGLGQLTIAGKRRMFELGKFLKKRYQNFLTENPLEVKVRSAESDRCLQSAHLVAAGAYPPQGRWVWDQQNTWQPFAVRTKPENCDGVLSVDADCPTAKKLKQEVMKSAEFRKYSEYYQKFFDFLSEKTGDNITNVFNAEYIHSTLLIERQFGFKLPNWVDDEVLRNLEQIASLSFYFGYNTKELKRLRAGLLLKKIKKIFKDSTRKQSKLLTSTPPKKFHIFSTHDTSVAALVNALGVYNFHPPPFGATVLFELHSNATKSCCGHVVKGFYLNVTESQDPIPLRLEACEHQESCSLKKFSENIQPLIPDNWKRECGLDVKNLTMYTDSEENNDIDNIVF